MRPPTRRRLSVFARRLLFATALSTLVLLQIFQFSRPSQAVSNAGVITAFDTPLTENFDGLASSGSLAWVDNSTIPGWYSTRTAYTAGTGSSNTGALYSFGVAGTNPATDRALGSVASGSTSTIFQAVKLTNSTGATITSLDVGYVGEQWRNGGNTAAQTLTFQYQVANSGVIAGANNPTGGWTTFSTLSFTSPITGATAATLDGNAAANRTAKSANLPVTVNNGQEIWLRWQDVDDAGSDHGLAIDDFSVTPHGAGPTNPSGTGASSPSSVLANGTSTTLLTVTVTPGTSPISTGLAVKANLSAIGGSPTQQFFDDGINGGDVTAGDKVFSFSTTVPSGTSGGAKSLPATITDAQSRTGSATIPLTVLVPTPPTGTGAANPNPVQAGNSSLLTVTVTPGANPTSTGLTVAGDLSSIGGSSAQQFFDDGTNGDATGGDKIFSFNAAIPSNTSTGLKSLPVQIADAQGRSSSINISLSVQAAPPPPGSVVISQVYGGGGNSGATLKNDFIEIFNRSANPVDLTGWSVQYVSAGSADGTSWQKTPLTSVIIQPGQYYLVQEAPGAGGSVDLPTPDATGSIAMSLSTGKVALLRSNTALTAACPLGSPTLMDFVGYGSGANCFEGASPTPTLTNTTAALRARNGCKDTDYNAANFTAVTPTPRNTSTALNFCPAGDEAPEIFSTDPANGGNNTALGSNITINFDQPVNVSGNWFQISCTRSGLHTATATGGPTTFTLDPDADFVGNEQCTVTVFASGVTDQDTNDPPDNMAADYVWSFRSLIIRDPAEHMVMGNPSGAVTDENIPLNYLMLKPQYALSYNNDKGTTNWTSWHLDSTWTTNVADRQNDFRSDDTLPASFKHVSNGYNFATYGFDRGHMCPSADRTSSVADNSATFLMTNMVPQASGNNQGPWGDLENYIRAQLNGTQNELYIVSGPAGVGGNSSTGHWDSIVDTAGNTVTVPQFTWKVVMVLPNADGDDVARVDTSTRTFAVIMPNNDNIRGEDWRKYLATVDQVEALTGDDFFSNVSANVQNVIEARLDDANDTAPVANSQSATTAEDTQKQITLTASDFNVNNVLTYTVVSGPAHGTLSGTGNNLNYLPDQDYNGSDSFTFKANDGDKDSNVATVSINVTEVNDPPVANADSKTTDEDTALSFPAGDLTANDTAGAAGESGQALTVTSVIAGAGTHGTVLLSGGQVTYTPEANYNGAASFDYQVCDDGTTAGAPDHKCATATVSVTVTAVNDPPAARDDSATTDEDTPATVSVLTNDTDVDGDTLAVSAVTQGLHGTVANNGDGTVTYSPDHDFNGPDSFTYTVSDGHGGTATANVSVHVNPVNDPPVLSNVPALVTIPELNAYAFTAAASDVDSPSLTFSLVGAPAGASINPSTGLFTWTPTEAQGGTGVPFVFKVRVSDGTADADADITINVGEVNQPPALAHIGDQTVLLGDTLTFTATATDADLPAQHLGYSLTGSVPAGASINPSTGQFTWTPSAAQVGQVYAFGVRATDDGPGSLFAEEVIHVGVGYTWTGFLQPINADGSSVFKLGRTVPVKFALTGPSADITNAVARLYVAKVSDNVAGTEAEAASTSAATTGNLFRYSDGQYIFNLGTDGLTAGTYQLRVDTGDGVARVVNISLR